MKYGRSCVFAETCDYRIPKVTRSAISFDTFHKADGLHDFKHAAAMAEPAVRPTGHAARHRPQALFRPSFLIYARLILLHR